MKCWVVIGVITPKFDEIISDEHILFFIIIGLLKFISFVQDQEDSNALHNGSLEYRMRK